MAYLTRIQMYRALDELPDTHAGMVFKPYNAQDSDLPISAADQSAIIDLFGLPGTSNRFWNGNWKNRSLGATNSNAGLNTQSANIGQAESTRRDDWKQFLDVANTLLMDLIGASEDDIGSHPNPALLDPDILMAPPGPGLEQPVKIELHRFRAHYAPSNLIQAKKDEYYAIAFAYSVSNSRVIAPITAFTDMRE